LAAIASQFAKPTRQDATTQAPPAHALVALARAQALPQAPQCAALLCVLTQLPEQFVVPGPQAVTQTPAEQTCGLAQALPQVPQWAALVRVSTQAALHTVWPLGQTH
jgi:hypothetical protein